MISSTCTDDAVAILGRLQTQLEECGNRLDQAMISEFQTTDEQSSTILAEKNHNSINHTATTATTAAICAIQKGELYYLDEWVDYHLALGFDTIYIYDNSDAFELRQWATFQHPHRVVVRHFPGPIQQIPAYQDCHRRQRRSDEIRARLGVSEFRHDWLAFLDIDEFIVLKKHDTIQDLVQDIVPSDKAGLSLHRLTFYFGDDEEESMHHQQPQHYNESSSSSSSSMTGIPVTKRFQYRLREVDINVKTISKTSHISQPVVHHVHYLGKKQLAIDTEGRKVLNGYSPKRPTDVAVIHHYETKSLSEFQSKCRRGDAFYGNYYEEEGDQDKKNRNNHQNIDSNDAEQSDNDTKVLNSTAMSTKTTSSSIHDPKIKRGNQRACMPRDWIIETFRNQTIKGGGVIFDDAAWKFLTQAVPQYARYDGMAIQQSSTFAKKVDSAIYYSS